MNGLALRISSGGSKMNIPSAAVPAIKIPSHIQFEPIESRFKKFINCSTSESQLTLLKDLLKEEILAEEDFRFLAVLFISAEPKHPIKCLITRNATKIKKLHSGFERCLTVELLKILNKPDYTLSTLSCNITAVISCSENFTIGSAALKSCKVKLNEYLKNALMHNLDYLKNSPQLSPTEKNEVFNLTHNILRALLNIVQNYCCRNEELLKKLQDIHVSIQRLFAEKDIPMDTKSLAAIVKVTMLSFEHGSQYWVELLYELDHTQCADTDTAITCVCLYSAIVTVVPVQYLEDTRVDAEFGLVTIVQHVLDISEKFSVEPLIALCVARTLLSVTKSLHKSSGSTAGMTASVRILSFVWAHVEHFMDSVRHLTNQILSNVLKYFGKHKGYDFHNAFDLFFTELLALPDSKKAYYVGLAASAAVLGTEDVLIRVPHLVTRLIDALSNPAVQSNAATTIESLLHQHTQKVQSQRVYSTWITPILQRVHDSAQNNCHLDTSTLNILENIIAKAVRWDANIMDLILPEAKSRCCSLPISNGDLKCVLVCLNLARRMGSLDAVAHQRDLWKGIFTHDILASAIVNSAEEIRMLTLSLLIETCKSTEPFTEMEFQLVLLFLRYNINTQAPHLRHLTLSLVKKLMKRFESSYRVLKKQRAPQEDVTASVDMYLHFLHLLRHLCFENLLPGANYSRRAIALQTVVWCEELQLDGHASEWNEAYLDKLILHLDDSYENNKILALSALTYCPKSYIESKLNSVLKLDVILAEASSVKPPDCVSAAYKLLLLQKYHKPDQTSSLIQEESPTYKLLLSVWKSVKREVEVARQSLLLASASAPMYGLVLCARHLLVNTDPSELSGDAQWTALIKDMIATSIEITSVVAPVVNNSSPEGHLPMDGSPGRGWSGGGCGVVVEGGTRVTAQMLLLCAWRSVKEVSLLLGEMSSRLHVVQEDGSTGTLRHEDLLRIGEHFTTLLAETKHRGAFEQAYVGFTKLCARLWRCKNTSLHSLPRAWLAELMEAIRTLHAGKLCATRRSAGVPFIIQALVTTELQVSGNPACFHSCISQLLHLADFTTSDFTIEANSPKSPFATDAEKSNLHNIKVLTEDNDAEKTSTVAMETDSAPDSIDNEVTANPVAEDVTTLVTVDAASKAVTVETRTHCLNILRALFRHTALGEVVNSYVGSGLMTAIQGFDGTTWAERNSSTLLFSALMVRIFGVQRGKDSDALCIRNKMTGRTFFLRYPSLYDFMLNKLEQVVACEGAHNMLHPSLYPVLLLLARLYPYSLEETTTNLKLVAFIPHVQACAGSCVLKTRQLAARAIVPLISHDKYIFYLNDFLKTLSDKSVKRNYCHGILLQVIRLLEWKPDSVNLDPAGLSELSGNITSTLWILEEVLTNKPCYITADEYTKLVNLLIWRFPEVTESSGFMHKVKSILHNLFNLKSKFQLYGRDIFLANAINLYMLILIKDEDENLVQIISEQLKNQSYEVVVATLNFLILLHENVDNTGCKFLKHIQEILNEGYRKEISEKAENLTAMKENLFKIVNKKVNIECTQKALTVLSYCNSTQAGLLNLTDDNTEKVVTGLLNKIQEEHENVSHIFIVSLCKYIEKNEIDARFNVDVARMLYENCSSDNTEEKRKNVVGFLDTHLVQFFNTDLKNLSHSERFEYYATLWAALVTLLEDDEEYLRQKISDLIMRLGENLKIFSETQHQVIPSKAAEILLSVIVGFHDKAESVAVLMVLALLDFNCEVLIGDEISDECRVFDSSEKYNTFLEESSWTKECVARIQQIAQNDHKLVSEVLASEVYLQSFQRLSPKNYTAFEKLVNNKIPTEMVNPKVKLCIDCLI